MRALASLLAFALLAGCNDPAPAPAQAVDDAATSQETLDERPLQVYRATFDLHLTEANTGGARTGLPPFLGVPSENCLGLAAGVEIERGFANATWNADTPASERFLLALEYGPGERASAEGASPLRLDLGGITTGAVQSLGPGGDGFQGSLLTGNLADDGAAADQEFRLDLWLEYRAGEPVAAETGFTCSPFTLPLQAPR